MNGGNHAWQVTGFEVLTIVSVIVPNPFVTDQRFNVSLVAINGTSIISSISVVSFAELNNTQIICKITGMQQETLVFLYGEPLINTIIFIIRLYM